MSKFRASMAVAASLVVASLSLPMPAAAQFTEGYKLLESVRKKEGQQVTDMLEKGSPNLVNYKDYTSGETALHVVTARRDLTWMQFLVGKGANVNARDAKGVTPLVVAANLGFVEGVEFLIERGAKVDESNNAGETPLITAVHNRNTELMRVLLGAGANPDRADNSGRSARDYAMFEGKDGVLVSTIEKYAKPRKKDGQAAKVFGPSF